ncbi:hypothetical protein [Aquimarina sp. 2201CG14-23]|uniref:hypothetical protein n=1 Tax=Aquimarina mycalae TaxID=3040073 RepID=UPI00247813D3|nr:hypothetical protein [Aquimarina sp. 2201CG14-23]MDH7445846.1 hypothetical protein [Aquimarina sp. 2201CG14-23]
MKRLVVISVLIGFNMLGTAQTVIRFNVALNDVWSRNSYRHIAKHSTNLTAHTTAEKLVSRDVKKLMTEQNRELYIINPIFKAKQGILENFITVRSFRHIQSKYPIWSYSNPIRNTVIQARFTKKFQAERGKLQDYLTNRNYMTEGKRVYLTLALLEKVINIATEHEEY